jgi:hypothetical protein
VPLRALIASREPLEAVAWPFAGRTLAEALDRYRVVLQRLPWARRWLLACGSATIGEMNGTPVLTDAAGSLALPIESGQGDAILPLLGHEGISAAGIWDGRQFTMLAADTALGRWTHE